MRTVRILSSTVSDSAELEFAYDRELIGVVRALRTRRWHAGRRHWIVAHGELDTLVAELRRLGVRVDTTDPAWSTPSTSSPSGGCTSVPSVTDHE